MAYLQIRQDRIIKYLAMASLCLAIFIIFYYFSQYYLALYTDSAGDQYHYQSFYDALKEKKISETSYLQFWYTGSSEPAFGYFMWFFSQYFEKNDVISIINGVFAVLFFIFLKKLQVSNFIIPLILTNHYWFVVLLAAERLKFACLCIIIFLLLRSNWRYISFVLAPLFHIQVIIFHVINLLEKFILFFQERINKNNILKNIGFIVFVVVLAGFGGWFFRDAIGAKLTGYSQYSLYETIKVLLMMLLAFFLTKDKGKVFIFFLPFLGLAYVVGGARINMMAFILLSYFIFQKRNGINAIGLIIFVYFTIKGFFFLSNIEKFGNGFPLT